MVKLGTWNLERGTQRIGVLAIQGDFAEHLHVLNQLGCEPVEVRDVTQLKMLTHLIIPGGESTVLSKFFDEEGFGPEIVQRVEAGTLKVFGTCAGAIIVAKTIANDAKVTPLELIDVTINRNAYGSQIESFQTDIDIPTFKINKFPAIFIRAPQITHTGDVEILASYEQHPVLVRNQNILIATFHPELSGDPSIHQYFLTSFNSPPHSAPRIRGDRLVRGAH